MNFRNILVGGLGLCLASASAHAAELNAAGATISVRPDMSNATNLTLTVSGPDGFHTQTTSPGGMVSVYLQSQTGLADGVYTWQLSGATSKKVRNTKAGMNNGRDGAEPAWLPARLSESGSFRVVGGQVLKPNALAQEETER